MKDLVKKLSPIADLALAPAAVAFVPFAAALARFGHWTPLSRRILDRSGAGLVRFHYYEPMVRPNDLHTPLSEPRPLPGLDLNEDSQLKLLDQLDYADELEKFPESPTSTGFYYDNGSYVAGDAEILYGMIRHYRPRRIVEIGSGQSTKIAKAALDANRAADANYSCEHVCIEPFENPWLEDFGVTVIRKRVEQTEADLFNSLSSGDILFIDSTHVIRPQGDVLHEYLYILPSLAAGVIIHIHDIFTPRDYPEEWIVDRRWMWNEQYLLEAFLSFNSKFKVLMATNWLSHNHRDRMKRAAPIFSRKLGVEPGSFWIKKCE